MSQARKARRTGTALRVEALEPRTLLNGADTPVSAPWVARDPVDPTAAVFVKFAPGTSAGRVQSDLAAVGGRVVTEYPAGPDLVALPPWAGIASALAKLRAEPGVAYAEADATVHATAVIPNDPDFGQLYGMTMIDAPEAWGVTTGTPATVVAVLDSGIDFASPDLAGKVWTNPNPSGADGYPGDVHGWNFVNNTANVQDNNGHGSHVSGVIAAAGNNAVGVVGVDWNAQIMPLKILDSQGNGSTDAAVSAVYFAVAHGAKVINASWGGDAFSATMRDALNYANQAGVVFVTAAGNESSNNDVTTTYPASYRTPNELVVAAVDETGNLASYSNYGPNTVDLAAPGSDIVSTVPGGYAAYSGTSMATPFVSGTVALLAGLHPGYSAAQLVAQVRASVKPFPGLNGLMISPGVVDPFYALLNYNPLAPGGGSVSATSAPVLVPGATSLPTLETALLTNAGYYAAVGGTPASYAVAVVRAALGRDPSPTEQVYLATALQNGLGRADLVRSLLNSPEGKLTEVARWYRDDLGSTQSVAALKNDAGVGYWAGLLAAGWGEAQTQAALFSNAGYYAAVGGTPAAYVTALYNGLLGRPPAASDLAFFAPLLASGYDRGALVTALLGSTEGRRAAVARFYRNAFGITTPVVPLESDLGVQYWATLLGVS